MQELLLGREKKEINSFLGQQVLSFFLSLLFFPFAVTQGQILQLGGIFQGQSKVTTMPVEKAL